MSLSASARIGFPEEPGLNRREREEEIREWCGAESERIGSGETR